MSKFVAEYRELKTILYIAAIIACAFAVVALVKFIGVPIDAYIFVWIITVALILYNLSSK